MALLSEEALEKLERSIPYLVADIIFNWVGVIGELFLIAYAVRWWHRSSEGLGFDTKFWFWAKVLVIGIAFLSIRWMKDAMFAWIGAAPPNYASRLGPKQLDVGIEPDMRLILDAQSRAMRIRERGIRVDQLLAENEARFQRLLQARPR